MKHLYNLFVLLLIFLFFPSLTAATEQTESAAPTVAKKWTGDLDGMIERRVIRVLLVSDKTSFFIDKGRQRGATYDGFVEFGKLLNEKLKNKHIQIHMVFIPVSPEELLPALADGYGDIAAANLTITSERKEIVDFTDPLLKNVKEILVTGGKSPVLKTKEDLSGHEVFVRKSSSYYNTLTELNQQLQKTGKEPISINEAPTDLADEDLLEMVQAGLVESTVVDEHKAKFWKQIFPGLVLQENIVLRSGGEIAWAIRKNSPQLKAELNGFIKDHKKGTLFGNILFKRYLQNSTYAKRAIDPAELEKFNKLIVLFQKYGDQYSLDWILMAAQGYQESRLDQSVKSHVGAIGVMQIMPATGKELDVGDIHKIEPNIHGGVKYIRFIIDQYYKDEPMDDLNKGLFAFASYNAGPARIRSLRKQAADRGLDPNRWFNNVELIAAEKIGRETVTYVSNIYKYYIAYKLVMKRQQERKKEKKSFMSTVMPADKTN